jgi:hypothetical protein
MLFEATECCEIVLIARLVAHLQEAFMERLLNL